MKVLSRYSISRHAAVRLLPAFVAVSVAGILLSGCGRDSSGKDSSAGAVSRQESFRASLKDSAALYGRRAGELLPRVDSLSAVKAKLLDNLEVDDRPEYVEIYRVARGWKGYDTFAGAGLLARFPENGEPEVVVTSAGGEFRSVILSSADGSSFCTGEVAPGSGLNYSHSGLTRVTFTGSDARALCEFAADHAGENLRLTCGGKRRELSARERDMLVLFGRLTQVSASLDDVQREYQVAFNKHNLYSAEVRKDSLASARGDSRD